MQKTSGGGMVGVGGSGRGGWLVAGLGIGVVWGMGECEPRIEGIVKCT